MWNSRILDAISWKPRTKAPAKVEPPKKAESPPKATLVEKEASLGKQILGVLIAITVLLGLATPLGLGIWAWQDNNTPKDVTTVYRFDPAKDNWVKDETAIPLPDNPDGTKPAHHNTVIIRVDQDNPIKQIIVFEALITQTPLIDDPLLEINGHDLGGSGTLRIGKLTFKKLDAKELKVDNSRVVRTTITNVVAETSELNIDVQAVNVVRILRGTGSSLFIGLKSTDLLDPDTLTAEDDHFVSLNHETGIRADRLRILGPSSGIGYIEKLVIMRTGVLGKVQVTNTEIQDLNLEDVSLDRT